MGSISKSYRKVDRKRESGDQFFAWAYEHPILGWLVMSAAVVGVSMGAVLIPLALLGGALNG